MIRGLGIRAYRFICTFSDARVFGDLLQEDGFAILQEDGGKIVLEQLNVSLFITCWRCCGTVF